MSTPIVGKCADCVERESLKGPVPWPLLLFLTAGFGVFIWMGLGQLTADGSIAAKEAVGLVLALAFTTLLFIFVVGPWFRRNLIGEYLYLFRDGKKQYHCHKERPARWISVKVEGQDDWRIIPGHILRVRNGGYFRWNCELRFEDNDKILMPTTSGVWQIRSWNATADLSLRDNSSGGIIPISREDWKHSKRLLGERAVDILSNGPSCMLELLKRWTYVERELNRVKAMHYDAEQELIQLKPRLEAFRESQGFFARLTRDWLDHINYSRKTIGKSKHAQAIRQRMERDIKNIPDHVLVELDGIKELRDELRAKDAKAPAAVTGG